MVNVQTITDSTSIGFEASSLCYPLCEALIDEWILVSEKETEKAMYCLAENHGMVVEGSAAMAYAGCLKYLDDLVLNDIDGE